MKLQRPPESFEGSIERLFTEVVLPILPGVSEVEHMHDRLCSFLEEPRPVFVTRKVPKLERRKVYETEGGDLLRPSDNAPAWWIHYLMSNAVRDFDLSDMPVHMFDVRVRPNINTLGWYVAHIFGVNDRNTTWPKWSRDELVRRYLRNVHPCNCFYLPRDRGRYYGELPAVMAFFAGCYAERYGRVWKEFLNLTGCEQPPPSACPIYEYGHMSTERTRTVASQMARRYSATRLCFEASVIEPLADDEAFEIETPTATFRLTKADFYRDFRNVVESKSYRITGIYHYPIVPAKAFRYRVADVVRASGLSLSHIGEQVFAGLVNQRPEAFVDACGLGHLADRTFVRRGDIASCEARFAKVDGKAFDGACRVDVVVRLRRDLALPVELKLGHTRLSKQRFDNEWLVGCSPSHGGGRWRGSVMAALEREFSGLAIEDLSVIVDGGEIALTDRWLLVVRESVLKAWKTSGPEFSGRVITRSLEQLVEALGGKAAFNKAVEELLHGRDFYHDWGLDGAGDYANHQ